jgi:hypothetical protein
MAGAVTLTAARGDGPSAEEVLLAVRRLSELIDSHGADNDREGRIAEPVVEQLYAVGAIGALTPRVLGGAHPANRCLQAIELLLTSGETVHDDVSGSQEGRK